MQAQRSTDARQLECRVLLFSARSWSLDRAAATLSLLPKVVQRSIWEDRVFRRSYRPGSSSRGSRHSTSVGKVLARPYSR
jgi:hypothetical protein